MFYPAKPYFINNQNATYNQVNEMSYMKGKCQIWHSCAPLPRIFAKLFYVKKAK